MFADQIRAERERLNLTQAECASLLNVSPRTIWQWEQGKEPIVLTQEGALVRLHKAKKKIKL